MPRLKGFVSYIISVLIGWSLLIILTVIEGKEKLGAELIGGLLGISLVVGPIISAIVLFPLVLLLYPLKKIYRNRKAKKAADEVLKQKLDI